MNKLSRFIATAALVAAAVTSSASAQTPLSGTPSWAQDYLQTVGGLQVTLSTPSGPKTIGGCTHEVGGSMWGGLSQDCRDLVSTQQHNAQLMARYDATGAIVRDLNLDGSAKDFVLQHWTRDVANDRFVFRYFPFTGMPYSGYGEFDCNANGVHCAFVHQMTHVPATKASRKARNRTGGLRAR